MKEMASVQETTKLIKEWVESFSKAVGPQYCVTMLVRDPKKKITEKHSFVIVSNDKIDKIMAALELRMKGAQ